MSEDSKDLKTLQKIWYAKLSQSGFIDVEKPSHPDSPLIDWHSLRWRNLSQQELEKTRDYFQKARDLLHTHDFDSPLHRLIWELHSEGLSKRKIEKAISTHPKAIKREAIAIVIASIAAEIR